MERSSSERRDSNLRNNGDHSRTSNGRSQQPSSSSASSSSSSTRLTPLEVESSFDLSSQLELELAETAELLAEATADDGRVVYGRNQKVVKRKTAAAALAGKSLSAASSTTLQHLMGLVRSQVGHSASLRNVALLCMLSVFVVLLVHMLDWNLERAVPQHVLLKPPHATSLGGTSNPGHSSYNNNNKAPVWQDDAVDDDDFSYYFSSPLPKDNSGTAIYSVSTENLRNDNGHFWHDPIKSPYASRLYFSNTSSSSSSTDFADKQQATFNQYMQATKEQVGAWTQPDFTNLRRPYNLFTVPHKDLPIQDFPDLAWQANATYVKTFIKEATELVQRVRLAIYREYGWNDDNDKTDDVFAIQTTVGSEEISIKSGMAAAVNPDGTPQNGVAFLHRDAFNGLVRKLLHAMMTEDEFYVVAAGGPHLYQGHNLWRTQIMQFQHIMEPVFDKLGMRLIARNMGMEASTTISALGGADVYGEADIFWYIADTRKTDDAFVESDGQMDLLQRQMILSGERVPVLLTPNPGYLATQAKAWVGNIQPNVVNASVCEGTRMRRSSVILPKVAACEYVRCLGDMMAAGRCKDYKSHCWLPRSDWNPTERDTQQGPNVGSQDKGYPNDRQHQLEGRKLALVVLKGLETALQQWKIEAEADRLPLADDIWHVGPTYQDVRESIRTMERQPGMTAQVPSCEVLLASIDPMICHMEMHVYTEWTPRVNPDVNRLFEAVPDRKNLADNTAILHDLYNGVDLLPLDWQSLGNDGSSIGDTHMVAIATNEPLETYDNDDYTSTDDWNALTHHDDDYFAGEDDDVATMDDGFRWRRELAVGDDMPRISKKQWTLFELPLGFCDGSSQSYCNRRVGNSCLMANHNYYRAGLVGHGNADWLNLTVSVTEGVIMLRFDWNMDLESNTFDLKRNTIERLPKDFAFDYSLNGEVTTFNLDEFKEQAVKLTDDLIVHPILLDRGMSMTTDKEVKLMELGIRIRSSEGFNCKVMLSHVYYA